MWAGIGRPADKRASHALPRFNMGAAWEADLAERKNTGLAVSDAKRLNDCYHELSEAIAARPEMPGDRKRWHYDYAALEGGPAGAEREAWNHKCGSKNIAEDALRGAVTSGNLQLWTNGPNGEAKVDRHELKELTFRTFATGTYQPDNRRLDNAGLAESPLWVKEADWQQYMAGVWTVRYGIDWANPAPPADKPRLPPEAQFVTLSQALTWIAFGVSMDNDHLHEVLTFDRYGEHDPQEAIVASLEALLVSAGRERIAMRAKYRPSHDHDNANLLTENVEAIKFDDYRQFSYLEDELRYGAGLLFWRDGSDQIISDVFGGGRKDSFVHVTVNRADLLREFRPRTPQVSESDHFRVGHIFNRDDPANIAPWWSINQALAWVATRIPCYVEYIGNLETDEPREHRPYIVQAICESQVAESDEGKAFMATRRAGWPDGTFLAHAGRDLLAKILAGEVRPMTRQNGQGRQMRIEEFVGIGARATGGDWLDLDPQPLFSSAEMMANFPQYVVDRKRKTQTKGGRPPEHDWDAMKRLAEAALDERPNLTLSKLADSLVSEYAEKVSSRAPVKRSIERKLDEWGIGATKPLSP